MLTQSPLYSEILPAAQPCFLREKTTYLTSYEFRRLRVPDLPPRIYSPAATVICQFTCRCLLVTFCFQASPKGDTVLMNRPHLCSARKIFPHEPMQLAAGSCGTLGSSRDRGRADVTVEKAHLLVIFEQVAGHLGGIGCLWRLGSARVSGPSVRSSRGSWEYRGDAWWLSAHPWCAPRIFWLRTK